MFDHTYTLTPEEVRTSQFTLIMACSSFSKDGKAKSLLSFVRGGRELPSVLLLVLKNNFMPDHETL